MLLPAPLGLFPGDHVGNQPGAVFLHQFYLAAGAVYGAGRLRSSLNEMPDDRNLLGERR